MLSVRNNKTIYVNRTQFQGLTISNGCINFTISSTFIALIDSLKFGRQQCQMILQYIQTLPIYFYNGHPSDFFYFQVFGKGRYIYLENDDVQLPVTNCTKDIPQLYFDISVDISLILNFEMLVRLCLF